LCDEGSGSLPAFQTSETRERGISGGGGKKIGRKQLRKECGENYESFIYHGFSFYHFKY
jgi:hypothetical protein